MAAWTVSRPIALVVNLFLVLVHSLADPTPPGASGWDSKTLTLLSAALADGWGQWQAVLNSNQRRLCLHTYTTLSICKRS